MWHSHSFTLYKEFGSGKEKRRQEVARYGSRGWLLDSGGVLVVDAREVDPGVAGLTCLVVLKKKRQRKQENGA